jgi:hypothetical protein
MTELVAMVAGEMQFNGQIVFEGHQLYKILNGQMKHQRQENATGSAAVAAGLGGGKSKRLTDVEQGGGGSTVVLQRVLSNKKLVSLYREGEGLEFKPLKEGVKEAVAWYESHHKGTKADKEESSPPVIKKKAAVAVEQVVVKRVQGTIQ